MEKKLTFNGLNFVPYITEDKILEQVDRVAKEIQRDYAGQRPLFIAVLNGAFIFAADLLRKVSGLCNNANQLAHVANSTGFAGRQSVDEMTRTAREVWRAVKEQW